ncbi:MAG: phage tail tube protein [Bacillota bacterium]
MANAEKIGGVNTYVLYGDESTYGTAGTVDTHFGLIQSFTPSQKNNLIKHRGFVNSASGGRDIARVSAGKYEAALSLEFQPIIWTWLEYVLGSRSGSGTIASPYIYLGSNQPTSMTIAHEIDNVTTDREEAFLGCIVNSCTIKASVGEPVSVSLDILSADMDKDATITANVALSTLNPFTFVSGSIEIPNGVAISNIIDSIEITINNNAEIAYSVGSRIGKKPIFKARDYTVKFTLKYLDDTFIEKFLGSASGPTVTATPTEDATIALKFENNNAHYVDMVFYSCRIDEFADPANLNEMLTEDITYSAMTAQINEVISS